MRWGLERLPQGIKYILSTKKDDAANGAAKKLSLLGGGGRNALVPLIDFSIKIYLCQSGHTQMVPRGGGRRGRTVSDSSSEEPEEEQSAAGTRVSLT